MIKERHNGYDPRIMIHPTDLDASKVQNDGNVNGHKYRNVSDLLHIYILNCSSEPVLTTVSCQIRAGQFDERYVSLSRA
ncbi:unnamed protein product, partial [Coregonus sp. 'balchen']